MKLLLLGFVFVASEALSTTFPGVDNPQRARVNYILNCQGCHGPDGAGSADGDVPRMKNFLGKFLSVEGGREFLIRVSGVANAPLSDASIAELLNWTLHTQSRDQIPTDFLPYRESDIREWRRKPLDDVAHTRQKLVARMR